MSTTWPPVVACSTPLSVRIWRNLGNRNDNPFDRSHPSPRSTPMAAQCTGLSDMSAPGQQRSTEINRSAFFSWVSLQEFSRWRSLFEGVSLKEFLYLEQTGKRHRTSTDQKRMFTHPEFPRLRHAWTKRTGSRSSLRCWVCWAPPPWFVWCVCTARP